MLLRIADAVRALERLQRAGEPLGRVGGEREQRVAAADAVPRLGVQVDARGVLHGVALARASGAEAPGGDAEREGVLLHEHAVALGGDHMGLARHGHRGIRIPALRAHGGAPRVHGPAVAEGDVDVGVGDPDRGEHLPRERQRELHDVGGAAAREHLDGLAHLVGVADGEPEGHVHVGEERGGPHPGVGAELDHGARELARPVDVVMKAPEPNFTSSTSAPVPSAIFLLMMLEAMSGIASTVPVVSRSA